MAPSAAVLIVAEVDDAERSALEAACAGAGLVATVEPSAEVAVGKLGQKRFDALVVHMGTPGAALACMRTRGKLLRIRIPVIALADSEDDGAFARAYRAGADEVLLLGEHRQLTARLVALPKPSIPQPGNARGDAVVADADRTRGEVIERVLKDAGFRVEVVGDGFAARLQAGRPSLKVAVVDASLDDVPPLITLARQKGSRCAWIVRARPELLDELRAKLARQDRVAVVSAYGPPDDVLFETNRLLEPRPNEGRSDPRLLHGTVVKLKFAGKTETDVGYTYNVSPLGLFVRTLVAPAAETVEVLVKPPGAETPVRLEAKVVWRREFGMTRKEPVPAGFGLQLSGGDIDAWAEACPRAPSLRPPMPDEGRSAPPPKQSQAPASKNEHPVGVTPPGEVEIQAREPTPSVEKMLESVLKETIPADEGAAPLSIDGGNVVELREDDAVSVVEPLPTDESAAGASSSDVHDAITLPPTRREDLPIALGLSKPEPGPLDVTDITPASLGFQDLLDEDEKEKEKQAEKRAVSFAKTMMAPPAPSARAARPAPAPAVSAPAPAVSAPASVVSAPAPAAPAARSIDPAPAPPSFGTSDTVPASSLESVDPGPPPGSLRMNPLPEIHSPKPEPSPVVRAAPPGPEDETAKGVSANRDSAGSRLSSDPPLHVPKSSSSPIIWAGVGATLVAGGLFALLLRNSPSAESRPVATPAPSASAPSVEAPAVSADTPAPVASEAPPAPAELAASAAPEPVASVAPSVPEPPAAPTPGAPESATASPPSTGADDDPAALATLKNGQGFLIVQSSLQTNVYVYGNLAGTTNQRITTNCGPRFLRLGTAPGAWQTEGMVAVVKCGALSRVRMKP